MLLPRRLLDYGKNQDDRCRDNDTVNQSGRPQDARGEHQRKGRGWLISEIHTVHSTGRGHSLNGNRLINAVDAVDNIHNRVDVDFDNFKRDAECVDAVVAESPLGAVATTHAPEPLLNKEHESSAPVNPEMNEASANPVRRNVSPKDFEVLAVIGMGSCVVWNICFCSTVYSRLPVPAVTEQFSIQNSVVDENKDEMFSGGPRRCPPGECDHTRSSKHRFHR